MLNKTHSEKLRDTLKQLLIYELGEYLITSEGGSYGTEAIRIVPPQVPDYISMRVVEIPLIQPRGIECLVYQDPRVEPSSMQPDMEFYEVAIRQHALSQPTSEARRLITKTFSAVNFVRIQQAQIQGGIALEQINLEIPRFYNFDSEYILKKVTRLLG